MSNDIGINAMRDAAHGLAEAKGWWDGTLHNVPEKLALIHSEISEALEEYRDGHMETYYSGDEDHQKPEGFAVELADAVIRICDLCGYLKIDLAKAISEKHQFNMGRAHRHGGKVC